MTVQVGWDDNDHTILLYTLGSTWTWDELYENIDRGIAMVETVPHVVDVLVDFQNSQLPPRAFAQFHRVANIPTPQTSFIVIAGGGTLLLSLFNLFKLIVGNEANKYYWVSDLNKARSTLAAQRTSLMV
jgi:hypothetical protein